MKFLLLAGLIFSSVNSFASNTTLPSGRVTITIMKTQILASRDNYERKSDVICKMSIPVTTVDTRSVPVPVISDKSCKFSHHSKDYAVEAYYGSYLANKSITPTTPKEDLLQLLAGFSVTTSASSSDFTPIDFSSFTTKDFNVKSAILEVYPKVEHETCAPGLGCAPKSQAYLEAIYEYEFN